MTRKNNQNTFSWSSTSSSFSNSTLLTQEDNALEEEFSSLYLILLDEFFDLPTNDKKEKKLSEILGRAASHGDIHTVRQIIMDERLRPYLNLDASDDEENDGSTPLIYASCFGKLDIVKYLLQVGAKVDVQDKIGWTALMWATTNGHHQIVQVLLEYSASSETKSASGRTIYDLVDLENQDMISILNQTKLAEPQQQRPQQQPQQQQQQQQHAPLDTENELLLHCEESFRSVHKFSWDQCLPDQMFVFAQQEVDHILNVAISNLKLPIKSRSEIYVPANIIFLCARFAHYFTSRELLHELLSKAVQKIDTVVKSNANDIHTLAFWIANLSQLLYYLKKDVGLVVATAEHQLEISELISEAYTLLVLDSEKRMDRILEPAMVEFEQIDGLEVVEFADDWHRFFRRSRSSPPNRRSLGNTSVMDSMYSPPSPQLSQQQQQQQQIRATLSPQSITSLMTSILYVLQSYDVHPVIVIQAIAQLFHFLSCEVFNRILFNKKHLCRSRALQIRMNLTVIEEWVREHHLPTSLGAYFNPVIQLVQLLQCVSQLTDLMDFINTVKSFDLLNPMQVKRLVLNYRYEVAEPKLPEEIEKYTMQIAEDTLKSLQTEKQQEEKRSMDTSSSSRPNSISSLGSLLLYSMSQQKKKKLNVNRLSVQSVDTAMTLDDDACSMMSFDDVDSNHSREMVIEKRDSKYMLPFSLPTTTNMVHSGWNNNNSSKNPVPLENMSLSDSIYFELKQKMSIEREKNMRERSVIPTIPEEWLERLDHHTGQY
ncbi:hypothetical protein HMPREF1544_09059 [Mucor circinelloides 1006PhL]|uniref:Dilute domain-containing protein n=1 Tax=Mucor circinelloides f. circinelloides (strain 1006PhL) TaxID=1220926 RepID=S2J2A6_MUCC1|nr:hypothetical protein HMPREF1544_09059 [Mucor circinelloides 1006PhL]